tara:strand:+ start:593 stop:1306 length:714 start_codon:yes stop_codon:yes gene_type:complete
MTIDVNNILTHYGKTSLMEEKTIDINNILTKHGKKNLLEKFDKIKEEDVYKGYTKKGRKKRWKQEIYDLIDSINRDGLNWKDMSTLESAMGGSDEGKWMAMENGVTQLVKVTAKLAAIVLLVRNKYYDPSQLLDAARFVGPRNNVTGNMAQAIRDDIKEIDKKFKLNFKLDKKLKKIKNELDKVEEYLENLVPYIDWYKYSQWADKGDVKSVGDMLVIGGQSGKLFQAMKKYAEETN